MLWRSIPLLSWRPNLLRSYRKGCISVLYSRRKYLCGNSGRLLLVRMLLPCQSTRFPVSIIRLSPGKSRNHSGNAVRHFRHIRRDCVRNRAIHTPWMTIHRVFFAYLPYAYITVKTDIHFRSVLSAFLCGNHYYAVGSACSVNSSGRSVFQDVYGFDFTGIQAVHAVFAGESVNNVKRFVTLGNGDAATYTDRYRCSRFASLCMTCTPATRPASACATSEVGVCIRSSFFTDTTGTGQIASFVCSVTDDNNFVQNLTVFFAKSH